MAVTQLQKKLTTFGLGPRFESDASNLKKPKELRFHLYDGTVYKVSVSRKLSHFQKNTQIICTMQYLDNTDQNLTPSPQIRVRRHIVPIIGQDDNTGEPLMDASGSKLSIAFDGDGSEELPSKLYFLPLLLPQFRTLARGGTQFRILVHGRKQKGLTRCSKSTHLKAKSSYLSGDFFLPPLPHLFVPDDTTSICHRHRWQISLQLETETLAQIKICNLGR